MSAKPDGGMAFPGFVYTSGYGQSKLNHKGDWEEYALGMSLRDYFAARFMERAQSICETNEGWDFENAAQCAYGMADAMLQERNK